jgi:HNH endonuclease
MTKEQIIEAVGQCTEKLGHVPSRNELTIATQVTTKQIRWHFGTYMALLRECNLERRGGGIRLDMDSLLLDWVGMVRDLGKLPSLTEYEHFSKYSTSPLLYRFGVWAQIPFGMKRYIEETGRSDEMKDVLEVIEAQAQMVRPGKRLRRRRGRHDPDQAGAQRPAPGQGQDDGHRAQIPGPGLGPDDGDSQGPHHEPERLACEWGLKHGRGGYGALVRYGPMVCAPTNEQGVLILFGAMAEKLGFAILKTGTGYPDCEAFRVLGGERLERVNIEFEYESRNFLKHLHDAERCDLIVCWRHNWPECPLPVIELRAAVGEKSGDRA